MASVKAQKTQQNKWPILVHFNYFYAVALFVPCSMLTIYYENTTKAVTLDLPYMT